jgi:hypothetical protein
MAVELENSSSGVQRTRRNMMKMGALAATTVVARPQSAAAGPLCGLPILGRLLPWCDPPPHSGRGGGSGANCFLKGTKIRSAEGERKIEELAVGDLLPTMFGGLRPIQWIGRYPFKKSDPSKPWVKDALPIRIARSALAPNVPHADLYVTSAHGLLIEGLLAPAGMLINGATITRCEPVGSEKLEYYHIKLESHDIVYAEGASAETLLNVDESAVNFGDYLRRYGMPITEEARCAPLVEICGRRAELKSRLRSALSPWTDFRNQADVIRDRVEERGVLLSRQAETV